MIASVMSDRVDPWTYFTRAQLAELSTSPADGYDLKRNVQCRNSYCEFIKQMVGELELTSTCAATAIFFAHRFFMVNSHAHKDNEYKIVAAACLALAGKVEETPRSIKDVVYKTYKLRHKKDPKAAELALQQDPALFEAEKQRVLDAELRLLSCINYEFTIQHPYKFLMTSVVGLVKDRTIPPDFKTSKEFGQRLAQTAWNFVNDSLRTTLALQYPAPKIAAATLRLASKFLKFQLLPADGEGAWYKKFNVSKEELIDIGKQIMDLYERPSKAEAGSTNGNQAGSTTASPAGEAPDLQPTQQSSNLKPRDPQAAVKQSNLSATPGLSCPTGTSPTVLSSANSRDLPTKTASAPGEVSSSLTKAASLEPGEIRPAEGIDVQGEANPEDETAPGGGEQKDTGLSNSGEAAAAVEPGQVIEAVHVKEQPMPESEAEPPNAGEGAAGPAILASETAIAAVDGPARTTESTIVPEDEPGMALPMTSAGAPESQVAASAVPEPPVPQDQKSPASRPSKRERSPETDLNNGPEADDPERDPKIMRLS